jgi:hypothetical protein
MVWGGGFVLGSSAEGSGVCPEQAANGAFGAGVGDAGNVVFEDNAIEN